MPQPNSYTAVARLIDSLINSLNRVPTPTSPENLDIDAVKPILLSLHALFPTILLPALDVLDSRLITRPILDNNLESTVGHGHNLHIEALTTHPPSQATVSDEALSNRSVYYVKSSASSQGRFPNRYATGEVRYEVRTKAWSCTCAAFAFAAYNGSGASDEGSVDEWQGDEDHLARGEGDPGEVEWGGLFRSENGRDPPLCKHLLACVMAERWAAAGTMIEERVVGKEEFGGWAAGWEGLELP